MKRTQQNGVFLAAHPWIAGALVILAALSAEVADACRDLFDSGIFIGCGFIVAVLILLGSVAGLI